MRLTDEQIKDLLNRLPGMEQVGLVDSHVAGFIGAIAEELLALREENHWIPVNKKEDMPISTPILVAAKSMCNNPIITVVWLDKNYWLEGIGFGGYEWEFDFDTEDITHYRLLPSKSEE